MELFTHPECLDHETPPGFPERPARLAAVLERLKDERLMDEVLVVTPAPLVTMP